MPELIEQKEIKLYKHGGSKGAIVPANNLKEMKAKDDSVFIYKFFKDEKGYYFEVRKK